MLKPIYAVVIVHEDGSEQIDTDGTYMLIPLTKKQAIEKARDSREWRGPYRQFKRIRIAKLVEDKPSR